MNEIYVKDISVNKLFDWFDQRCLVALEISWQLEGTVEESWEECRRHAEDLRLVRAIGVPTAAAHQSETQAPIGSGQTAVPRDLLGERIDTNLFGEEIPTGRRRRRV